MKMLKSLKLKTLFVILIRLNQTLLSNAVTIKFTKLECIEFDKTFIGFKSCYLKVLGRNKIGLNLHVRLLKIPVSNVTVSCFEIVT